MEVWGESSSLRHVSWERVHFSKLLHWLRAKTLNTPSLGVWFGLVGWVFICRAGEIKGPCPDKVGGVKILLTPAVSEPSPLLHPHCPPRSS